MPIFTKKPKKTNFVEQITKDQYVENLKNLIKDDSYVKNDILGEEYLEWCIMDWNEGECDFNPKFNIGGYEWEFYLKSYDQCFDINLRNLSIKNNRENHICVKCVLSFCNPKNYSHHNTIYSSLYNCSKYNVDGYCYSINYNEYMKVIKPLIKNNRVMICAYIKVYNNEKNINNLKELIEEDNEKVDEINEENYYEWEIKDWNSLEFNCNNKCSPEFSIAGYNWGIILQPNNKGYISLELINKNSVQFNKDNMYAKFILYIRNCNNYSRLKAENTIFLDCKKNGFQKFIRKTDLYSKKDKNGTSYIENNKIVIGAYVRVFKMEEESILQKTKEQYINKLKNLIEDNSKEDEIVGEGFYEWKIEDWNKLDNDSNSICSPEFIISTYKWEISLYPKGEEEDNYISIYLINKSSISFSIDDMYVKFILYIRNCNDFTSYKADQSVIFLEYQKNGFSQFIKKTDLYDKFGNYNKPIIEDGKAVIGAYIRIYKYKIEEELAAKEEEFVLKKAKEEYINKLKDLVDDDNKIDEVIKENYYEWEIEDWNKLGYRAIKEFSAVGCTWEISLFPEGEEDEKDYVSFYISNKSKNSIFYENDDFNAKFVLFIRNFKNYSSFKAEQIITTTGCIGENYRRIGFSRFIKNSLLYKVNKFYKEPLVDCGKTVVGAYIIIYKNKIEAEEESLQKYKENYLENLKYIINDNKFPSNEMIESGYFEWVIKDLNKTLNAKFDFERCSPEFMIGGHIWKIGMEVDQDNNEYIKIILKNMDIEEKNAEQVWTRCIISFHPYKDYIHYKSKELPLFLFCNSNNGICSKYIHKSSFNKLIETLINDSKIVLDAYLCIYNNNEIVNELTIKENIEENNSKKEEYINQLKNLISDNNTKPGEIIGEGYHEWIIDDWEKLKNESYSQIFEIGSHEWKIYLYKQELISDENDKTDAEKFISLYLYNHSYNLQKNGEINVKFVLSIRNLNDYSCYKTEVYKSLEQFNKKKNKSGCYQFIKNSDLNINFGNTNKPLIENNKVAIDTYIRVYNSDKIKYIENLKYLISDINENTGNIIGENYYEWEINNWDELRIFEESQEFEAGDHNWSISLYPRGRSKDKKDYISVFLNCIDAKENNAEFSNCYAKYILSIHNNDCFSYYHSESQNFLHCFNKNNFERGFPNFIKKSESYSEDKNFMRKSLIKKGKTVITAYVRVYENDKLEKFIKKLKGSLKRNHDFVEENYYERQICYWDKLNTPYTEVYRIGSYNWKISLYPNGKEGSEKEYLSFYIKCLDLEDENNTKNSRIYIKYILYIRNYNDYSCYKIKASPTRIHLSKENPEHGFRHFIKKSNLYAKRKKSNLSLIENDKLVIGAFIRVYTNDTDDNSTLSCDEDMSGSILSGFSSNTSSILLSKNDYTQAIKSDLYNLNADERKSDYLKDLFFAMP